MIRVELKGRLGNQMFIYSFIRALQAKYPLEKIVCNITGVYDHNGYNSLLNYNIKPIDFFDASKDDQYPLSLRQKIGCYIYSKLVKSKTYTQIFNIEKNFNELLSYFGVFICQNGYLTFPTKDLIPMFISGYFQSEKYFYDIREDIKRELTPKLPIMKQNLSLANKIQSENAVCVDVRLGDYMNHPLHGVCNPDYYVKAMEVIAEKVTNPIFFVFSDDIQKVQETINFKHPVVFEDGKNPDYEKMRLMSLCKHFIISNSSYSWWAQYLCQNPSKIVVAPSKWFAQEVPCAIYQESWEIVDV